MLLLFHDPTTQLKSWTAGKIVVSGNNKLPRNASIIIIISSQPFSPGPDPFRPFLFLSNQIFSYVENTTSEKVPLFPLSTFHVDQAFCIFSFALTILQSRNLLTVRGGGDDAVVRALANPHCGPGSILGPGVTRGLSLLFSLVPAPRIFLRVLRLSFLQKK